MRRASILALGLLAACATRKAPIPKETDAERRARAEAAITAAERALAIDVNTRGGDAIADLFEDDGAMLISEVPIRTGRDVVRGALVDAIKAPVEWRPLLVRGAASGDFGFSIASFDKSKALIVWRARSDDWRIAAFMKNRGAVTTATAAMASVPGGRPWPIDTLQEQQVLMSLDADFSTRSVTNGRADAFEAFAAEDAVLLNDGGSITVGRRSISGLIAKLPEPKLLVWSPRIAGVAESGELGFTVGESRVQAEGEQVRYYGKYLTVWRWTAKDGWKFAADGGNESPAPTIAPKSTRR